MATIKHPLLIPVLAFVVSLFFFIVCVILQDWSNTQESYWIIGLFCLPLLTFGFGCVVRYRAHLRNEFPQAFYVFESLLVFFSVASYCLLWVMYLNGRKGDRYSYFALILACILVGSIGFVTFVIMRPAKSHNDWWSTMVEELRPGLVTIHFWALLHFFAIFLSVAFVFGFALAFHDRSIDGLSGKPPLYKPALPFHDRQTSAAENELRSSRCFHFAEGKAELETLRPEKDGLFVVSDLVKNEIIRRRKNYDLLDALVDEVKASPASKLARITLIGHANETRIKDTAASYLSNYELSQARTQVVRYEISRVLIQKKYDNWRNVEWIMLPLSNEQSANMQGPGRPPCKEGLQDNKVVEASVEYISNDPASVRLGKDTVEFERLDLMGYMYFSIYTITTTGYGDVIPTTAYAKFLTSLANVFAIFFLVGFINALISLKDQRKET